MLVQVISGHIEHDKNRYEIGDSFHVSETCARRLESLKVAKIIGTPAQEEQPVVSAPEVDETPEKPAGPVDTAKAEAAKSPVVEPKKKRGRRSKRG